jgi:hypothetical protein
MKRLATFTASLLLLSSLVACGHSNTISYELTDQNISTMSVQKEEEHVVVNTAYQNPATHYNSMKLRIDFSCPEGGQDTINASSFLPMDPYKLVISHHTGNIVDVDLNNKEKVENAIEFVSELKTTNEKDAKVVAILINDLNKILKNLNTKKPANR